MLKSNRKGNDKKPKVLKLNLSATMGVAGAIVFIILAIVAVRMIVTAINSSSQKALAEEETKGYTMVDSTELGEDGRPLQVPVPDGFSASQVPRETTVNGGFVIYEGEVDWSKIEDLDSYAEVDAQEEADASPENSNLDSSNSENSEEVSEESNKEDATSNSDSTVNEGNSEEVVQEEQIQDVNSEQADLQENLQENVTSDENEMIQEQIDKENAQEEIIDTEQIENTEELEQGNNEIIDEEEEIANEETEAATMAEEGEDAGIATLAEGETPTTVFDLQTSVNQYVWVPVKDISRIYGVDSNGKLWGKLYEYSSEGRTNKNWSETNGVMSINNKTGDYSNREPDVTHYRTAYDVDARLQSYRDGIEQYQMLSQEMEESFYKMIESIKKYGGFYIGRYETGNASTEEIVVMKMNTDINYVTWYKAYELCKNIAGEEENVETTMISGSLWDETLQWLIDSKAKISTGETIDYTLIDDSTKWGNYKNATFEYTTTSGGTRTKNKSSYTDIPTGSAEYTKVNNIYDMAGNVYEWTLEAYFSESRVSRGGYYYTNGNSTSVKHRDLTNPNNNYSPRGSRCVLYIK